MSPDEPPRYFGRGQCVWCGWQADRGSSCFWCLELFSIVNGSEVAGQPSETMFDRVLP